MSYRVRSLFFVFTFLVFVSIAVASNEKLIPLDIKIDVLQGQVRLTRVSQTLSDLYAESFQLLNGDIIETLQESKAQLVYNDGTVMRLKPLTKVEIQQTSLKVFKGKSWFKFVKRASKFIIETPSLVAGIRGTTLDVSVSSRGKTVLSVMEGAVAVSPSGQDPNKNSVLVEKGSASICERGGEVSQIKFNETKKATEWRDAEWGANSTSLDSGDINQLMINYYHIRREYGESDPRTIEAMEKLKSGKVKTSK